MVANLQEILSGLDFSDPVVADRVTRIINGDPKLAAWAKSRQSFYYTFKPRPNRPEVFDEQQAFMDCMSTGVIFLIGGNAAGTTTCALMKAIYFMLKQQPPPRKDTPFWIISSSYESTIKNAWKDKIAAKKMIPDCEVDWDRITWYRNNEGLPLSVPLKPWPIDRGGDPEKNWTMEFKSYEQGREQLQARSIGGFIFMEQFPYELLIEVVRGCRDYNFPGSKICEFTPINPVLSAEIEDMDTNGTLPPTWKIFRANTAMNTVLAAGWLDEFTAQISDEMRDTRLTGAWGSYEGCIYQGFSTEAHVVDLPRNIYGGIDFPPNVFHRRGVDWGASQDHPFAMVWAYRDGMGAYWFYDEYWNDSQNMTIWDHADEINSRCSWPDNPHYGPTFGDPSRPDMFNNFAQLGISVQPARNDVLDGIESMRQMMKPHPGTGRPRFYVDRKNCPRLIAELRRYRWTMSKTTGLNPNVARPVPLKRHDDLCDAARYLIHTDLMFSTGGMSGMHVPVDPARHGVHLAGRNGNRDRRERERDERVEGDGNGNGNVSGSTSHRIRPRR